MFTNPAVVYAVCLGGLALVGLGLVILAVVAGYLEDRMDCDFDQYGGYEPMTRREP